MINKSKLEEIRRSLYDDDGYTRINNPHFDLIFEEAFKAGMNHVNNGSLDDVNNFGGIVIPNKLTDKNRILSRAMTYISEDADEGCSIAKQIFIELGSLIEE